jgi:hypothetical protein
MTFNKHHSDDRQIVYSHAGNILTVAAPDEMNFGGDAQYHRLRPVANLRSVVESIIAALDDKRFENGEETRPADCAE